MSDSCSCGPDGHDHYNPTEDPLVMAFAIGVARLHPSALVAIIQTCVAEMYIRCPEGMFASEWEIISDGVQRMFDPDTTMEPEALANFEKQRKELAEDKDKATFIDSVLGDLKDIMDEDKDNDLTPEELGNIVVDINKNVPKTDNDDDFGNYL